MVELNYYVYNLNLRIKSMQQFKGVLLLALLFIMPLCSSAKFPGILQRYQLGYTFVMNSAEYEAKNRVTLLNIDTSFKRDMKTSAAFGVTMGTYVPLKRLGQSSMLVLGIDYMYNIMTWESKVPGLLGDVGFSGATAQMALPIGLDFKFGADALNVKNRRFCATLGAGVYPSYAITTLDYDFDIDPNFSVAPYVKAEAGIFAGICMKVRAIASFGKFTYMDYKSADGNSSSTMIGNTNFAISLLVMPFSFTWKEEEWWNTF